MSVRIRGTVTAVEVDPSFRDRLRRWVVRIRVDGVLDGKIDADELALLVHSPSVTFRTADPLGESYILSLDEPVADPYLGPFDVQPDA